MATTLVYEDYQQTEYSDLQYPIPGQEPSRSSAGISAFGVPDFIEIDVSKEGGCRFRFSYPDDESVSREDFSWPGVRDLIVRVGHHSRRVRELTLRDARTQLVGGGLPLPILGVYPWTRHATPRAAQSACRNATVVANIMARVPSKLIAMVLDAIEDLQR